VQLRSAQALGGRDVAQLQRRAPPLDKQNRNYIPKRDNGSRHRGASAPLYTIIWIVLA
jgi:hypothetical protein